MAKFGNKGGVDRASVELKRRRGSQNCKGKGEEGRERLHCCKICLQRLILLELEKGVNEGMSGGWY